MGNNMKKTIPIMLFFVLLLLVSSTTTPTAYAQVDIDVEVEATGIIGLLGDAARYLIPQNVTGNNPLNATDAEINHAVDEGLAVAMNVFETTMSSHGFAVSLVDIFYDGEIDDNFVNLILLAIIASMVLGFIITIWNGLWKLFIVLLIVFGAFMFFGVSPALG